VFISVGRSLPDADALDTNVVVVLGMHRSGTSSVAGALVRLGAAPPKHLIAPNADNERGYCESPVLVDLNNAILAAGGSSWTDWRKFDPDAIEPSTADALRARAIAALETEFGAVGLGVLKDPRMCRLMPFWTGVFEEARWSPRALLPIRSPLEVALSISRRNGLSPAIGCLLWLRHVLDAEAETRGMARAFLDWGELLADTRNALAQTNEQLGVTWPYWGEDALADIEQFISAELRHQKADENDLGAHPAVTDLVRQTYAAMLDLVRDPDDRAMLRTLDDLRASFDTASAIFNLPMREARNEAQRIRSQAASEIARAADAGNRDGWARGVLRNCSRLVWRPRSSSAAARAASRVELAAIRNSPFFNSAQYLEQNADVRATGMDPAVHYLVHGSREGRDPGPFFSTKAYLARYPDVAEAGLNPLAHYEALRRGANVRPAV
jgi:hypothetical protein